MHYLQTAIEHNATGESMEKYWPFSDTTHEVISFYEGESKFLSDYENCIEEERNLFCAWWCQAEVLNGGLEQFFLNDTGVLAPEAVQAFYALNAPKLAQSLEKSMSIFGSEYPRNKELRQSVLTSVLASCTDPEQLFDALDEEFCNLLYEENGGLEHLALEYCKEKRL